MRSGMAVTEIHFVKHQLLYRLDCFIELIACYEYLPMKIAFTPAASPSATIS